MFVSSLIVDVFTLILRDASVSNLLEPSRRLAASAIQSPQEAKNFLSIIRKYRVSESGSSKFAEYEVACQFRVTSMRVQKEIVYKWSVWRRFSEFEQLHATMKRSLGWQLESIEFPSSHTFVMNKMAPDFLEQRK